MASSALAGCSGVRPYAAPRVFSWRQRRLHVGARHRSGVVAVGLAVERLGERGELVGGDLHPALLQGAEVAVAGTELLDVGVEALLVEEQLVELGDDVGLGEVLADDGDGLVLRRSGRVAAARGRSRAGAGGLPRRREPVVPRSSDPAFAVPSRARRGPLVRVRDDSSDRWVGPDGRVDAHGPRGPVRVDAADQPFLARSAIVFSLNLSAVSLVTTIASLSWASAWSSATRLLRQRLAERGVDVVGAGRRGVLVDVGQDRAGVLGEQVERARLERLASTSAGRRCSASC